MTHNLFIQTETTNTSVCGDAKGTGTVELEFVNSTDYAAYLEVAETKSKL